MWNPLCRGLVGHGGCRHHGYCALRLRGEGVGLAGLCGHHHPACYQALLPPPCVCIASTGTGWLVVQGWFGDHGIVRVRRWQWCCTTSSTTILGGFMTCGEDGEDIYAGDGGPAGAVVGHFLILSSVRQED